MSRRVTYIENSGVSERHPSLDVTRKDQRSMRVSFSDFMSRAYVKASTLSRVRPFSVKISIERERARQNGFLFTLPQSETDPAAKEAREQKKSKNKIVLLLDQRSMGREERKHLQKPVIKPPPEISSNLITYSPFHGNGFAQRCSRFIRYSGMKE